MDRLKNTLQHIAKMRKARAIPGFVYLIQCQDFVKVGVADNVKLRLTQLQVGCPFELRVLVSFRVDDVMAAEARLHCLWQRYEVRGEWFRVPFGELVSATNAVRFDDIF